MITPKLPGYFISGRRISGFRQVLLSWFPIHGRKLPWRKAGTSTYVSIVVEILLQRTRAETIARFLPEFLEKYPEWRTIATSDREKLADTLKPIGLWRVRSSSLQKLARTLIALNEHWPSDREELESLPAVGQYVANAVLLFIYNNPQPLLDSSVARLLRRYFVIQPEKADIRHDVRLHAVAREVLEKGNPIELNWALLDLASKYCFKRSPKCAECPLKRKCMYSRNTLRG